VKGWAAALGLEAGDFSGHSLRAGYATSAVRMGRADRDVMRVTRHRSVAVFSIYNPRPVPVGGGGRGSLTRSNGRLPGP
jgi:integrase